MTTYSVNPTLTNTSGNTTTQNVATGDTINVTVAPGSSNATVVNTYTNATNCSVSPSQDASSPFTFTINTFTSTSYSAYFYFVDGNTVTWDVTVSGTVSSSPTYSVTAPASINEGSSGTMNVSTTNVGNGTTLYWTVEPSGDFGTSSGSFSISSNAGSFTVTPSADQTTEGAETGTIRIRTGSTSGTIVASDTFTINDTSTTPASTYSVTAPASINEGSAGTMNVSTTNVSNGTTLYWTVTPSGDFGTSSGNFTINSNAGSFTVTPTADSTTEGSETGTIQIRTGSTSGTIVASDTFTINDTSTTPAGPGLGVTIDSYTSNPTRYNNNGTTYTTATTTVVATSAYTHGLGNCASNTRYWASYTSGASGDTATYSTISPIGRTYNTFTDRTLAGMSGSSTSIALPSSYGGSRVYIWADLANTTVTSTSTMTCTGASYYIEYPDDAISLTPSTTSISGTSTANVTVNVTGDTSGTQYRLYTSNINRWVSTYNGGGSSTTDFTISYDEASSGQPGTGFTELPTTGNTYTYFSQCRVTAGVNDGANSGGGALWINTGNSFTVTRSNLDTQPKSFELGNPVTVVTGVTANSATITIEEMDTGASASYSITNTSYSRVSKNGGTFSTSSGTVVNGDTLQVQVDASTTSGVTRSTTLSVGSPSTSDSFSVTSTTGGGGGGTSGGGGTGSYGLRVNDTDGSTFIMGSAERFSSVLALQSISLTSSNPSDDIPASMSGVSTSNSTVIFLGAPPVSSNDLGSIVTYTSNGITIDITNSDISILNATVLFVRW